MGGWLSDAARMKIFLKRAAVWATWPVLLAACIALPLLTPVIPSTASVEYGIHDAARYMLAKPLSEDPDVALLLYSDSVARTTGHTSPVDRALLAKALTAAENAGAKAVGIDMIFSQSTPDEGELIAALAATRMPVYLAYADPDHDRAAYWDPSVDTEARAYQDWFWSRIAAGNVHKVSPVIGADEAGVARRWPDIAPGGNPPLAAAMAGVGKTGADFQGGIRFTRLPSATAKADGLEEARGMVPELDISLITDPALAEAFAPLLKGRYVLIGSDTFNSDQLVTPITRSAGAPKVAGVTVHGQMLRQSLDRQFPTWIPAWGIAAMAALMAALGAATAVIERRPVGLVAAIALQLACLLSLPLLVDRLGHDILSLPLFGLLLSWLLAFLAVGYGLRTRMSTERAFARSALGKFLPEEVARQILDDPQKLSLAGEERSLFLMFTDLEGFTKFSHGRDPREVARLLNQYLETMSAIVLAHKGTLDKFVGDAIVAFWGAPIASDADGKNAVACALALQAAAERLRKDIAATGDSYGRTRIGLHHGMAVVGNFGGADRIQYTALGDAMNIAARLEGANKYLRTDILVSGDVARRVPDVAYRPMGRIRLSGVATPLELFEPVTGAKAVYAADVAIALDGPDVRSALTALASRFPEDLALAALAERGDALTGGEAYALQSK